MLYALLSYKLSIYPFFHNIQILYDLNEYASHFPIECPSGEHNLHKILVLLFATVSKFCTVGTFPSASFTCTADELLPFGFLLSLYTFLVAGSPS